MAAKGRHWVVDAGGDTVTVEIFGLKGMAVRRSPAGVVASLDAAYDFYIDVMGALSQVDFSSVQVSGKILEAIREQGEFDYVVVSSRWAVCLWLERKIELTDLLSAEDDENSILLTLKFGGRDYKVLVVDENEVDYHLAFGFKDEEEE